MGELDGEGRRMSFFARGAEEENDHSHRNDRSETRIDLAPAEKHLREEMQSHIDGAMPKRKLMPSTLKPL